MDIFCQIANGTIPSHKVYEDDRVMAFLDIAPASYGHTLVIPKSHVESFLDCPPALLHHMLDVAQQLANVLMDNLKCDGINLLSNAKEAAGQTVPHFHIHLIPRYQDSSKEAVQFSFGQIDPVDYEQLKADIAKIQ